MKTALLLICFLILSFWVNGTDPMKPKKWCVVYLGKYDQIWVKSVQQVRGGIAVVDRNNNYLIIKVMEYRGWKCF